MTYNLTHKHASEVGAHFGPVRLAESWLKLAEKYCSDWNVVREKHCSDLLCLTCGGHSSIRYRVSINFNLYTFISREPLNVYSLCIWVYISLVPSMNFSIIFVLYTQIVYCSFPCLEKTKKNYHILHLENPYSLSKVLFFLSQEREWWLWRAEKWTVVWKVYWRSMFFYLLFPKFWDKELYRELINMLLDSVLETSKRRKDLNNSHFYRFLLRGHAIFVCPYESTNN